VINGTIVHTAVPPDVWVPIALFTVYGIATFVLRLIPKSPRNDLLKSK